MRFILLISSSALSLISYAQFPTQSVIDSSVFGSYIKDIELADMNNDGHLDVVCGHNGGTGGIAIYFTDPQGNLGQDSMISSNGYHNNGIDTGDFNNDGWLDVVGISGKVTTYVNQANGTFTATDIANGIFFPHDVKVLDLDQDGYDDIVALGNGEILSFTNDGTGDFDSTIVGTFSEFYTFCVGDINGDNYPDMIVGGGKIFTLINDGTGTLVRDSMNESIFTPLLFETELADMDNDGDLDLVVYYTNVVDKVDWYENDGTGELTLGGTITSMANNIHDIALGDLNNDNTIDVCFGYDQTQELVWIENYGNGSFSPEQTINSSAPVAIEAELGDLDGDGDLEIVHVQTIGLYFYDNQTVTIGIEEEEVKSGLNFYPNPSTGLIYLEADESGALEIYSLSGQLVYSADIQVGTNEFHLDLASGTYICVQHSEGDVRRGSLILE
jgi:hypothetical protein